jgi:hypothetical protein
MKFTRHCDSKQQLKSYIKYKKNSFFFVYLRFFQIWYCRTLFTISVQYNYSVLISFFYSASESRHANQRLSYEKIYVSQHWFLTFYIFFFQNKNQWKNVENLFYDFFGWCAYVDDDRRGINLVSEKRKIWQTHTNTDFSSLFCSNNLTYMNKNHCLKCAWSCRNDMRFHFILCVSFWLEICFIFVLPQITCDWHALNQIVQVVILFCKILLF